MELDENAKNAARELGDAINAAVAESSMVSGAIAHLRDLGYDAYYTLNLKIALERIDDIDGCEDAGADVGLELTDEDLRTLQRMKIKYE
jgi:gamma-glutamyltranspeptidase